MVPLSIVGMVTLFVMGFVGSREIVSYLVGREYVPTTLSGANQETPEQVSTVEFAQPPLAETLLTPEQATGTPETPLAEPEGAVTDTETAALADETPAATDNTRVALTLDGLVPPDQDADVPPALATATEPVEQTAPETVSVAETQQTVAAATEEPTPAADEPPLALEQPPLDLEQPQPVTEQPQPVAEQPQPVAEQPQPVTEQPETVAEQPETVTEQPETVTEQPEAVTEQPQPVTEQPQPVTEQPETVTEQPETVAEQPQAVTEQPQPVTEQPQPVAEQPQPTVEAPPPEVADPAPAVDEAQPAEAAPRAVANVQPDPNTAADIRAIPAAADPQPDITTNIGTVAIRPVEEAEQEVAEETGIDEEEPKIRHENEDLSEQIQRRQNARNTVEATVANAPDAADTTSVEAPEEAAEVTPTEVVVPAIETVAPVDTAHLIGEGNSLMASGDILQARQIFMRSISSGSAEAALALGRSYDPKHLAGIRNANATADPVIARKWYEEWYRRSVQQGSVSPKVRLERLLQAMNTK